MKAIKHETVYKKALELMPGGGMSGGRHNHVAGRPFYLDHGEGSRMYDVDGNEYIDYHCCAGAAMFGYNHPRLRAAAEEALRRGFFTNFDSEYTLEFADLFTKLVPTVEQVRMTNSGTEATMGAIRLARGYTGRDIIVRFDGHFHGMSEQIWYNHGNFPEMDEYGEVTQVVPDSAGIPERFTELIKVIRFNDIDAVRHVVKKYKGQIAGIIMEPISYNCGCYEGEKEYMKQVREICTEEGILLIYDEVISGLRFRPGSAQMYYGVKPDISTFAKAIGGTFPLALIGGTKEVMQHFNPIGPVRCGGTCVASQIALLPGIECLKMALEPGFYDRIEEVGTILYKGMNDLFTKHGVPGHVRGKGAQFGIYFGYEDMETDMDLRKSMERYDMTLGKKFIKECLNEGIYFHYFGDAPYPPHCGFGSQHTLDDIQITLERMDRIFARL